MGILFGIKETRSWIPEPPIAPFPGANIYGQDHVGTTPEAALAVPTVWACVNLLANAVSMLPLETFRTGPGGVKSRATDPPLLVNPSGDMTQSEWLHMLMVSLLLRGNCIGRIVQWDSMRRPVQIEIQNPDRVNVRVDQNTGALTYKINTEELPATDVWHVRGMTLPGSRIGLSPVSYAAATIGVDLGSRRFAQQFFEDGGVPKAILTSDQRIDRTQGEAILERVKAKFARSRDPLILGAGLKYEAIQVKPEESQFLATQQANVAQIARYFGVPASMVGGSEGGSMTYQNVEQRSLDFLTYAVAFWLKRIEDAVFPLLPAPQYVRFNTAALLRTDSRTQAEVDNMQLAGKTRVGSELRARDGLPPFTAEQKVEADMVPLTITPSGSAKALPALKAPPGPEALVPVGDTQGGGTGG